MRHLPWPAACLAILLLALISCRALAAGGELLRVLPVGQIPEDQRLKPRHLDAPAPFDPQFADKAAWEARAADLRLQIQVANGLWPMPEKTPLNPVIHGRIDKGDYTVEKVFFASMPGHYVTGNLYRPKGEAKDAKRPAVLCPHGHWPNGRFMWANDATCQKEVQSGGEATIESARSPLQSRCVGLARLGCVVFHYDMVGYADSTLVVHRKGFTDLESQLRLQSQMGLQTWNSIRALDFVSALPDVDPARIAVTGASGGGTQTFILGAVDDRPAVSFPAVMVGMNMQGGCVCENAPLLRVGANNVEIAALVAPKPLGITAANDWTRDMETRGQPELKRIFKLYGDKLDAERLYVKHFAFGHNYNQVSREAMYEFMNKHLKLGHKSPIKEKPFEPIDPKELSVFNTEHPRPKDDLPTEGIRAEMTRANDAQMAALAKNLPEYRKVVSAALRAMCVQPAAGVKPEDILVSRANGPEASAGGPNGEKFRIMKGTLERRGEGERVPYAAVVPSDWNGTVVVWAAAEGKAALLGEGGRPAPAVQKLLDAKVAVAAADVFLTGEYHAKGKTTEAPANPTVAPNVNPNYAAFTHGYNRTVLGSRVHDLLTLLAHVRGWEGTKKIHLVAEGKAGVWALLARALAGDTIDKAAIDLASFDFDQVKDPADEMMLPGATKYGGIYGLVPVLEGRKTLIAAARKTGQWDLAGKTGGVTLTEEKKDAAGLVGYVME